MIVKYLVSVIKKVADSGQKVGRQQAVAQVDPPQGVAQADLQQAAAQRPQKKGQSGGEKVYFRFFFEPGTFELNTAIYRLTVNLQIKKKSRLSVDLDIQNTKVTGSEKITIVLNNLV